MIKALFILSVFFVSSSLLAEDVKIKFYVKDGRAYVKNEFCFPVVISVNALTLALPMNVEVPLQGTSWSQWNWMPGLINSIQEKSVLSPLIGITKVDFGPGVDAHSGSSYYGYDFSVPVGTEVYSMEEGIVIKAVNLYESAHQDVTRMSENNQIKILHQDGTVAQYSHLKKDGLKVKVCDVVKSNQVIGLSGNTGYSKGPHLHVDILKAISGGEFLNLPITFGKRER